MTEISLLLLVLGHVVAPTLPERCSVGELRHQPSGYQYRVERIADFVDSAEAILHVEAVDSTDVEAWPGHLSPAVRFRILAKLRGAAGDSTIVLPGRFVDRDDFNPLPVPYQMVRPSGQRGDCYAKEYRRSREYLLLLRTHRGRLTAEWMPLAPLNEQVQGMSDEWLRWVRALVDADDRATRARIISRPAEPSPYIALRLVVPEYMPGAERAEHGSSTVFLAPRPLLADPDLLRVEAQQQSGEPLLLRLYCRPQACERLAGLTAHYAGRSLALVIDAHVRHVVPIMSSVGGLGYVVLNTGAMGADARRIVQEIRTRWPPQ